MFTGIIIAWINEGDTVDLTFSSDNLEKVGDNSYFVTNGFLYLLFEEYVENSVLIPIVISIPLPKDLSCYLVRL